MLARKLITKTAAGGSWAPTDLGANLLAWYDCQDSGSLTLTGSSVDQWNDLSGNGNHLTQSTSILKPTYGATSFNSSKPGISFDGNDWLQDSSFGGTTGSVLSVFAVGQMSGSTNAYGRLAGYSTVPDTGDNDYSAATTAAFFLRDSTNNAIGGYRNGGAKGVKAVSLATPCRMGSVYDGTNHTAYVDNSAGTSVSSSGAFTNTGAVFILGRGGDSGYWNGFICEVIVCITDLTADSTTRADMDSYFTTRWGL
jgi:hypothetical protein